jgi:hypothetical protein
MQAHPITNAPDVRAYVLDPATWADLLVAGAEAALVQALREAESYRAALGAALTLLHAEQAAHAETRARYRALLDEHRAAKPRRAVAA